jgi:glycine hydroxymethyltransferase
VCRILDQVQPHGEQKYTLEPALQEQFRQQTEALCAMYPIREYGDR